MGDMADFFLLSEDESRYEEPDFPLNPVKRSSPRRIRVAPLTVVERVRRNSSNKRTKECIDKWKGVS